MISFTYEWEREYVAAILETDNVTLATLIAVAESTMLARVGQLNRGHVEAAEERSYLATAIAGLEKLRTERLGRCAT
jgi:hypothetical protein